MYASSYFGVSVEDQIGSVPLEHADFEMEFGCLEPYAATDCIKPKMYGM